MVYQYSVLQFILSAAIQVFTGLCHTVAGYLYHHIGNIGPSLPRRLIISSPGPEFTYRSPFRSAANARTGGPQTKCREDGIGIGPRHSVPAMIGSGDPPTFKGSVECCTYL